MSARSCKRSAELALTSSRQFERLAVVHRKAHDTPLDQRPIELELRLVSIVVGRDVLLGEGRVDAFVHIELVELADQQRLAVGLDLRLDVVRPKPKRAVRPPTASTACRSICGHTTRRRRRCRRPSARPGNARPSSCSSSVAPPALASVRPPPTVTVGISRQPTAASSRSPAVIFVTIRISDGQRYNFYRKRTLIRPDYCASAAACSCSRRRAMVFHTI